MNNRPTTTMSEKRKIIKTTGLLSLLTLLSRFTGLIRDSIMAAVLGASGISDVFNIAFELSNLLRRVLGEGSLSAFIVPLFVERRKESEPSGWHFANRAINAIGILSLVLTLLGMIFSWGVFYVFGGAGMLAGADGDPAVLERFHLGVRLTRLMFPNLIALAVGSIMMGVCNALNSFTAPAIGSAILNVVMIVAGGMALFLRIEPQQATVWLGWSVLAGAAIRVFVMIPPMTKHGWRWELDSPRGDAEVRKLFGIMGTGLFGMSVNQINLSVASIFATYSGVGVKTYLTNAGRLIQFPMALTATAMATAMLPQLTRYMLEGKNKELRDVMGFIKRVEMVLMLPAVLGLMFFGLPIVELIFQRRKWTEEASIGTADALLFYAPALIPFGWSRIVLPLYYARKDIATTVKAAIVGVIVNIALGAFFTFYSHLAQRGLAIASTAAAFADYGMLTWQMRRDPAQPLAESRTAETFLKCLVAGLIAIGGGRMLYGFLAGQWPSWFAGIFGPLDSTLGRGVLLLPLIVLSSAIYFPLCHLFRVPDSDKAFGMIKKRFSRGS